VLRSAHQRLAAYAAHFLNPTLAQLFLSKDSMVP
jgi:hypothetical protein